MFLSKKKLINVSWNHSKNISVLCVVIVYYDIWYLLLLAQPTFVQEAFIIVNTLFNLHFIYIDKQIK